MESREVGVTVVHVGAVFNLETAAAVRERLSQLLTGSGHVILDLSGTMVDSTGLGAVLSLQRRLELQERRLLVVACDPRFSSLLQRAGVQGALTLFEDMDDAVGFAQRHARELYAA